MILEILHSDIKVDFPTKSGKGWMDLLNKRFDHYRIKKKIKFVGYWWVELDNDFNLLRKIAFDVLKFPIVGLDDLEITLSKIDYKKCQEIDKEVFNDVWYLHSKNDFKALMKVHSKYLEQWKVSSRVEPPVFPILITNFINQDKTLIIETVDELLSYDDITG